MVVWRDGFTAAFTGISRINPRATKSTSEWIAEVLADHRLFEDGVVALQQRASERLAVLARQRPVWKDLRLAIVVTGFDFHRFPRFVMVSNFLPGGPYPTDPSKFETYSLQRMIGPDRKAVFATAGADIEPWHEGVLGRAVPRTLEQHDGITRAARIMVALQRKVADKNPRVGRDAMCIVIPRARYGMRGVFGRLNARTLHGRDINFCYFEDGAYSFKQLGPHVATGDGRAFGDFYGVADPNNLMAQGVSMRQLKTGPLIPHWATIPPDIFPGLHAPPSPSPDFPAANAEDDGPYGFGIGF